jgi:hypothetical protein
MLSCPPSSDFANIAPKTVAVLHSVPVLDREDHQSLELEEPVEAAVEVAFRHQADPQVVAHLQLQQAEWTASAARLAWFWAPLSAYPILPLQLPCEAEAGSNPL